MLNLSNSHHHDQGCGTKVLKSAQDRAGNESDMGSSQEVWDVWGICWAFKLWEWASSFLKSTWESLAGTNTQENGTTCNSFTIFNLDSSEGVLGCAGAQKVGTSDTLNAADNPTF
eukprot:1139287-Pelagomonas_calceolata.AAC.2